MEQKLANCGRCGLEAVKENDGERYWVTCPVHRLTLNELFLTKTWNAAQFAARTERINAAAVAICAGGNSNGTFHTDLIDAEELVAMQDERARVRWVEMQKGE